MKTAMQELIEEIQYWKEKVPLGSAFKDCLIILEGSATNKLEKEKEHLMMAFNDGKTNAVLKKRTSEEYYDQLYNQ